MIFGKLVDCIKKEFRLLYNTKHKIKSKFIKNVISNLNPNYIEENTYITFHDIEFRSILNDSVLLAKQMEAEIMRLHQTKKLLTTKEIMTSIRGYPQTEGKYLPIIHLTKG